MEPRIRPATRSDLPAILAIYNDAILTTTATWDEVPWPMAQREEWFEEHEADPSAPVLVAEVDGAVAGFAYLSWYRKKTGYRFTREDTVYIDPAFHRRGIGRRLLEELIERAHALEIHAILAVIEATNVASLELHGSLGFVVTGTEREIGFKFGRWLGATTMELLMRPPGAESAS